MAIKPIYRLIAKLLKANRRLKKKASKRKLRKKKSFVEHLKTIPPAHKKYTHTPEYYRKRLGDVETHTQEQIKEAITLCAKSDELEHRENTALADAYSLFNTLNKQIAIICNSDDAKDKVECGSLQKKRASVAMIIKQLDPKAMIGSV
jgi:hypothetical protein